MLFFWPFPMPVVTRKRRHNRTQAMKVNPET